MRILLITPYYPPATIGGIESHVSTLAGALRHWHRPAVLAPGDSTLIQDSTAGITVYRSKFVDPSNNTPHSVTDVACYFRTLLLQGKFECLLAHNMHQWVQPEVVVGAHLAAQSVGVPVALRLHNHIESASDVEHIKNLPWAHFLCVSRSVARQLTQYGISEPCLSVVYPPIDTGRFEPFKSNLLRDRFHIPEDNLVVLHASRIYGGANTLSDKGLPTSIEVISAIGDAHLVVAYPAIPTIRESELKALRRLRMIVDKWKCGSRVHLIRASRSSMPAIYNSADVYMMLPRVEAFGQVYIEAAACALPTLGARVGGVPEAIIHETTGFVVHGASDSIIRLRRFKEDISLRQRYGDRGADWVRQEFSALHIASKVSDILRGLCYGKKG
jgi:glycosyltransferase involved in cell wall biosynthesis